MTLEDKKENTSNIRTVVYSTIVADLFHYGHLKSLQFASYLGDYHICAVHSDKVVESCGNKSLSNLKERKAIVDNLKCVDRVIVQDNIDPTENLKKINEEFKDAQIIIVHGDDWRSVPGTDFVKEIGGKVIQHPYYSKLSDFKIVSHLCENYKGKFNDINDFTDYFNIKGFIELDKKKSPQRQIISTKANTLKALRPLLNKSKIEKTFDFTVDEWKNKKDELLKQIQNEFQPNKIVVRSSAINEDTLKSSMAGYFHSVLDVLTEDTKLIENAILQVIDSYTAKNSDSPLNQVLIQQQTQDIVCSGVLFTKDIQSHAPYYVINYDDKTGLTDTVTKGVENKTMYISRYSKSESWPDSMKNLLVAVKEIEEIIPFFPLDIEFAINKNKEVIIFQARPITTSAKIKKEESREINERLEQNKQKFVELSKRKQHLAGETTFFGDMPDWNPAEIIGHNPNELDYFLYDYVITDKIWHIARSTQGYSDVNPAKLVVRFANKPYIDIRHTFNSFIPAPVSKEVKEKLMSFYLNKLKANPELQDKVEFEVVYTCYDLDFDIHSRELIDAGLTTEELEHFKNTLLDLTNNQVSNSEGLIQKDLDALDNMVKLRDKIKSESNDNTPQTLLKQAIELLDDLKINGTLPFSRLARLAFIGKIILKSMVKKEIITKEFYDNCLNSISTVASEINSDFNSLMIGKFNKEEFLKKYGHLRPGTYDITALRYDQNPSLIQKSNLHMNDDILKELSINDLTHEKITTILKEHRLTFSSQRLFTFIKKALESREFAKFEFSKSLSDAIELIATAGKQLGFSRESISHLDMDTIKHSIEMNDTEKIKHVWEEVISSNKEKRHLNNFISLPPVIFSPTDIDVVSAYVSRPNFITQKEINATVVNLHNIDKSETPDLEGKIVMLENGDPGYDWIFTKNPAGLITKYGGVASHMAIRCAEFGIPAAIGAGDHIFNQINNAKTLLLNCKKEIISKQE